MKTETKQTHTPGLWMIAGQGILAHPTSGRLIETTQIEANGWGRIFEVYEYSNEREANLRLIAAAPEILEALYAALPYVEDALDDPAFKKGAVAKVEKQIRAAIAKAEGTE